MDTNESSEFFENKKISTGVVAGFCGMIVGELVSASVSDIAMSMHEGIIRSTVDDFSQHTAMGGLVLGVYLYASDGS